MRTFQKFALNEGLIQIPPKIYKHFETALFTFAFSHIINEVGHYGFSKTITKILKNGFQIAIIPQTLRLTNLIYLKEKDLVNVEFDVLGKYIKNVIK